MDRERAKELLPIIQAFAEGKKIECSVKGKNDWSDKLYPTWVLPNHLLKNSAASYM